MLLSVVIPTLHHGSQLQHCIDGVQRLRALLPYPIEVLAVNGGSTREAIVMAQQAGFQILHVNRPGIGLRIRAGMLSANGMFRMLIDPSWSIPPEQVQFLLPPALSGFDVALASRQLTGAKRVNEPFSSFAIGRMFNHAVQTLVLSGFEDTQFNFKCFRAEAARTLFSRCKEEGPAIHVEALALSQLFGLRVKEVPVDWTFSAARKVHILKDSPTLLTALLRIRARLATDRYAPLQVGNPPSNEPQAWTL